jgi:hypothetical protein
MERERDCGARKLFAVCADGFLFDAESGRMAEEKLAGGEWREDWIGHLRDHVVLPAGSGVPENAAQLERLLDAPVSP